MKKARNESRLEDLRGMLEQRRHDVQSEVSGRMRTIRGRSTTRPGGVQASKTREDLECALLQIHAEMVDAISAALVRLDAGDYGRCQECGEDIAEKRLRALPFATCCKDCREAVEMTERRNRQVEQHGASLVFGDVQES